MLILSSSGRFLRNGRLLFLISFSLADWQKFSASSDIVVELLQMIHWLSRFSLRSQAWTVVFGVLSTLFLSPCDSFDPQAAGFLEG